MNYINARRFIIDKLRNELPENLHYHGLHHTFDVLANIETYALSENISGHDLILLKTAALFHDCGFIQQYKSHENIGAIIASKILSRFDYKEDDILIIADMIRATNIYVTPKNKLEEILCDADLDYLGREDFFIKAQTLKIEFYQQGIIEDEREWEKVQINFMEQHKFYTKTGISLRRQNKLEHLKILKTTFNKYQ